MVITISRENGSGGQYIGEELARRLHQKCYDKELVQIAAQSGNVDIQTALEHDEVSRSSYMDGKTIFTKYLSKNTMDEQIFRLESDVIRQLAQKEDCIIIGRCGAYVLQGQETINVFLFASDVHFKIQRKVQYQHLSAQEAEKKIRQVDQRRAVYYEYHTGRVWGNKKDYDLCIDTSKVGIENTICLLELYYQKKKEGKERAGK